MPFKMRRQEDGMIKIYKTEESIVNEIEKVEDGCWINMVDRKSVV